MPAVVRVKRRIDEEPLSAFVLNGKKRRLDNEKTTATQTPAEDATAKDELSTVLKFAGTIKEQDDTATSQFARKMNKAEAKQLVLQKTSRRQTNTTTSTDRARQQQQQSLHEQRFRVVNCLRTTLDDATDIDDDGNVDVNKPTNSTSTANGKITIVDIEPTTQQTVAQQTPSPEEQLNQQQPTDSDTGYVYDLYLPENEQQAAYVDMMDDNYLSVHAFDDLHYEDCYDNDEDYDSEDSNQENHFGNDYPDSEDDYVQYGDACDGSTDEIRHAIENFVFDDDDEDPDNFSSDDEDYNSYQDPYVHTVDAEEEDFADDVDYCDVDRYGMAYARYKARVLKNLKKNAKNGDDDDDDEEKTDSERYESASENGDHFD